jgi:methyl-accepting chemotaxis protein
MAKQRGVSFKFVIISSALALVLLSAMTIIIINSSRNSQRVLADNFIENLVQNLALQEKVARQDIIAKGKSTAMLLDKIGSTFIIGYDFDSLQQLAQNASMDQDIDSVLFTDPANKALVKAEPKKKNELEIKRAVKFEGEVVGQVVMRMSLARINKTIEALNKRINTEKATIATTMADSSRRLTIIFAALALGLIFLLCCVIYYCLQRLVIRPVTALGNNLNETICQVADASGELTGSSQSLADDASSQAASLEEVSASMEEISTMTRQNADNAGECNSLMNEVSAVVGKANESIIRQTESMSAISAASEETSKIIKTIDEIAFQTNLLALNAAVEAARAGEAGAGFAVVADEVRNLAMRSAKAAKSTTQLIEETAAKINEGSSLAAETNENFGEVAEKVGKAGSLVSEISTASNEQTIGLSQVNKAISDIDQVTQRTAANAEETASAAAVLLSLSKETTEHTDQLMLMLNGSKKDKPQSARSQGRQEGRMTASLPKPRITTLPAPPATLKKSKPPEDIIPMDSEDDFEDF